MQVLKFGGGILKNAGGIRQLPLVLGMFEDKLVVVVSAFGKTTNAMEILAERFFHRSPAVMETYAEIHEFHQEIVQGLFPVPGMKIHSEVDEMFRKLRDMLGKKPDEQFDRVYDQLVSFGEMFSSLIVSEYLKTQCIPNRWIDIRTCLKTDDYFREGRVLWDESAKLVASTFAFNGNEIFITQGFIGSTLGGLTTTLGREGSDFTAAILGNLLDAEKVQVFKDVPGILNADPRWMPDAEKLEEISYQEAIELSYFGAQVIHPKTIKPLENKKIPLVVRSYYDMDNTGTLIHEMDENPDLLPVFIRKEKQVLISVRPRDFKFSVDESLDRLFSVFIRHKLKINLIQNSAISITLCANQRADRFQALAEELKKEFNIRYNENLVLYTIRHYNDEAIKKIRDSKEVLIEQRTRGTIHFLVKE